MANKKWKIIKKIWGNENVKGKYYVTDPFAGAIGFRGKDTYKPLDELESKFKAGEMEFDEYKQQVADFYAGSKLDPQFRQEVGCVACSACWRLAGPTPDNDGKTWNMFDYTREGDGLLGVEGVAYVKRQPETPEEKEKMFEMRVICPVQAIGENGSDDDENFDDENYLFIKENLLDDYLEEKKEILKEYKIKLEM